MNNDFLQKVNEEISVEENAQLTNPDKMELAPEVRAALIDEILDLHHEYEYKSTTYGVEKVVDAWWENKGRAMTQLFGNHPNYVPGKFQIVFDSDYNREIDTSIVLEFLNWVFNRLIDNEESYPKEVATYEGCIGRVLLPDYQSIHKINSVEVVYLKTAAFDKVHRFYSVFRRALELGKTHILTEQAAQEINDEFPDIRAREGQKKSRAIGKMCKKLGIDKHPGYNREYAKLCDAVNPLNIVRHTIISWNPVDYYTMSFGNSWASCHTIDKKNIRRGNENYSGCYSGGTISYMLDGVSVVFYTVDKQYDGEEFELQDKINRCMFHIDPRKEYFVQGRVYPQDNDGENSIYRSIRNIMQKIISDSWGVANLWQKPLKGRSNCEKVICHCGANYADYFNYGNCNVSLLAGKNINEVRRIDVGHSGICPCCGDEHDEQETMTCAECFNERRTCADCGYSFNENDMYLIGDDYYCEDCCSRCEECGDLCPNNELECISGFGSVCDSCLENRDEFEQCYWCDEWVRIGTEDAVTTSDGTTFCCGECARRGGYVFVSETGEYECKEDCSQCEECGEYVLDDDFDFEEGICCRCVSEREDTQPLVFSDEPIRLEDIA